MKATRAYPDKGCQQQHNFLICLICWPLCASFRGEGYCIYLFSPVERAHVLSKLLHATYSTCSADTSGGPGSRCRSRLAVWLFLLRNAVLQCWESDISLKVISLSVQPRTWLFSDRPWGTKEPYRTSNWLSDIWLCVYSSVRIIYLNLFYIFCMLPIYCRQASLKVRQSGTVLGIIYTF